MMYEAPIIEIVKFNLNTTILTASNNQIGNGIVVPSTGATIPTMDGGGDDPFA